MQGILLYRGEGGIAVLLLDNAAVLLLRIVFIITDTNKQDLFIPPL